MAQDVREYEVRITAVVVLPAPLADAHGAEVATQDWIDPDHAGWLKIESATRLGEVRNA